MVPFHVARQYSKFNYVKLGYYILFGFLSPTKAINTKHFVLVALKSAFNRKWRFTDGAWRHESEPDPSHQQMSNRRQHAPKKMPRPVFHNASRWLGTDCLAFIVRVRESWVRSITNVQNESLCLLFLQAIERFTNSMIGILIMSCSLEWFFLRKVSTLPSRPHTFQKMPSQLPVWLCSTFPKTIFFSEHDMGLDVWSTDPIIRRVIGSGF